MNFVYFLFLADWWRDGGADEGVDTEQPGWVVLAHGL